MSLSKRPVNFVRLHTGIFIPGIGNVGDSLPSANKTFASFSMHHEEAGVYFHVKQLPQSGGKSAEGLLPWAAVAVAVYGPELKEEKPAQELKTATETKTPAKK